MLPDLQLFDLSGRVALVTGAARGLGLATAVALARAGASVVVTDLEHRAAVAGCDTLPRGEHHALALDVTSVAAREIAFVEIERRYGRLDILVNNAGIVLRKNAVETKDAEFLNILNINLVSMLGMSSLAAPIMARGGGGRIVNLSSITGLLGRSGVATYSAAKAGVTGLSRSLAAEFGPYGICVNAVAPGYLITEMNSANTDDPDFFQSVIARTPLRRWGAAEDMAGIMVFLASPASAFITGQTILLDGGIGVTLPAPTSAENALPGALA